MIAWRYMGHQGYRKVLAARTPTKPSFHIVFLVQTKEGEWYIQVLADREKIDVSTEEEAKAYVETLYRMGEL